MQEESAVTNPAVDSVINQLLIAGFNQLLIAGSISCWLRDQSAVDCRINQLLIAGSISCWLAAVDESTVTEAAVYCKINWISLMQTLIAKLIKCLYADVDCKINQMSLMYVDVDCKIIKCHLCSCWFHVKMKQLLVGGWISCHCSYCIQNHNRNPEKKEIKYF